jgi:hypothetical protein
MRPPGEFECFDRGGLAVRWTLGNGARLHLAANLADSPARSARPPGRVVYASHPSGGSAGNFAAPWSVLFTLEARVG